MRVRKIIFVFFTAVIIFLITFLTFGRNNISLKSSVYLAENNILLTDVHMTHAVDEHEFVKITARAASFDPDNKIVNLENTDMEYTGRGTTFSSHADSGALIISNTLTTRGNIYGSWNSLKYTLDENGTFIYDFKTKTGVLQDNIVLTREGSKILAQKLFMDIGDEKVLLSGGVSVFLNGGFKL